MADPQTVQGANLPLENVENLAPVTSDTTYNTAPDINSKMKIQGNRQHSHMAIAISSKIKQHFSLVQAYLC